jgi:hypothetical protein
MNVENDWHSGAGSFAKNIFATFHSSDRRVFTTISFMVSEFLHQIPAGWVLRMTAQQQTRKINMTPAPALRVKAVKESEITCPSPKPHPDTKCPAILSTKIKRSGVALQYGQARPARSTKSDL